MKQFYSILAWPIRKFLLFIIIGIRPLLGPANCRFHPTCGNYAVEQLKKKPLIKAIWNICKQLLSCANPFQK